MNVSTEDVRAALVEKFGNRVRVQSNIPTNAHAETYDELTLNALRQKSIEQEFAARRALLRASEPVDKIRTLIGVQSRQTIHNWIEKGKVLALDDGNKKMLPVWQFDASMRDRLVPGFKKVFDTLNRSPFSAALWFTNRNPNLGNRSPIDLLRTGSVDRVLAEAKRANQSM